MAYERARARAYAQYYWNRVCHDGRVATGGLFARAAPGASLKDLTASGGLTNELDCTHFVSCCIGAAVPLQVRSGSTQTSITLGGGLKIRQPYGGQPFGIDNVSTLIDDLCRVTKYAEIVGPQFRDTKSLSTSLAIASSLREGDLLAYSSENAVAGYIHFAIIVGKTSGKLEEQPVMIPTIACHTTARFDALYTDVRYDFVTLIRIKV